MSNRNKNVIFLDLKSLMEDMHSQKYVNPHYKNNIVIFLCIK
jgi:hypothetical protein